MDQPLPQMPSASSDRLLRLSPTQLDDLVAMKLRDVCAGIADWKLPVTVVGLLGDMPTARYSGRIYKLPLVDPEAPASITYLNVREATLKRAFAEPGDLVEATGTIVAELFKGVISFRLDAVAVERQAPAALPERGTPRRP